MPPPPPAARLTFPDAERTNPTQVSRHKTQCNVTVNTSGPATSLLPSPQPTPHSLQTPHPFSLSLPLTYPSLLSFPFLFPFPFFPSFLLPPSRRRHRRRVKRYHEQQLQLPHNTASWCGKPSAAAVSAAASWQGRRNCSSLPGSSPHIALRS